MKGVEELEERLRASACRADELREHASALLVESARDGNRAGLSQREIAALLRRSQPEVSRLLRFRPTTPRGCTLSDHRREVTALARAKGARHPRVFGSVARGEDGPESDIDLLVDLAPGTSLLDIARLEAELSSLLRSRVEVTSARGLRRNLGESVRREAVPL